MKTRVKRATKKAGDGVKKVAKKAGVAVKKAGEEAAETIKSCTGGKLVKNEKKTANKICKTVAKRNKEMAKKAENPKTVRFTEKLFEGFNSVNYDIDNFIDSSAQQVRHYRDSRRKDED